MTAVGKCAFFRRTKYFQVSKLRFKKTPNRKIFLRTRLECDLFQPFKMKTFTLMVLLLARQNFGDTLKILKCCRDNKKFDFYLEKCIAFKEQFFAPKTLVPPMDEDAAYWIPPYLRSSSINYSNVLGNFRYYDFKAVIAADNKTVSKFLQIDNKKYTFVTDVFKEDLSNYLFETQEYCFESSNNPKLPHVIKTAVEVMILKKCCRKGQQLNRYLSRCENQPGKENREISDYKWVPESVENTNDTHWVPSPFTGKKFNFTDYMFDWSSYNIFFGAIKMVDEVSPRNTTTEVNKFAGLSIPVLKGKEKEKFDFCFDTVRDGPLAPKVMLYHPVNYPYREVKRCCLPGEILSDEGFCVTDTVKNPRNASFSSILGDDGRMIFETILYEGCMQSRYETKTLEPCHKELLEYPENPFDFPGNWIFYCVDLQSSEDGTKEVLGKCRLPSNVELYESVRPLGAISAMFLLAAIVASLVRKQTRTSAHGWGLACHALCLATVNTLQVTWFFASKPHEDCSLYAYPTYYFMVAGHAWLSAITGNMLYGFCKPLRALASGRGTRNVTAVMWKQFALMSLVAWGIPSAMTAWTVTKYKENEETHKFKNRPSFLETRLCIIGLFHLGDDRIGRDFYGSMFHYYIPVALLVIGNAACVIFVAYKIRSLNQDQAFLHADNQQGSSYTQSALMYLKLLLMAGVLELSLEVAAISIRLRENKENWRQMYHAFRTVEGTYYFIIGATVLDLGRAIGVLWLCTGWHCRIPGGWLFWCKQLGERRPQFSRKASTASQNTTSSNIESAEITHF